MIVLVVYPDDCSAKLSVDAARALMAARGPRHGLRFYTTDQVWDGTNDGQAERRKVDVPVAVDRRRTRAIQSVARDIGLDERKTIVAAAVRMGPEQAGRIYGLSKHSVQECMKLEGLGKLTPGVKKKNPVLFGGRA